MEDSLLLLLTSIPEKENNWDERLSPTPSVSNLSLRPCHYLSTVTRSSNQGSVDGFRRERLQRLATFDSLSVQRRLEARSQMESRTIVCYLDRIWRRLESLERITTVFLWWIRRAASLESPTFVNLYVKRKSFTGQSIKRP